MIRTLLRAIGLVYFIAFCSFGVQAHGLIGSRGILPFADYLRAAQASLGARAYWEVPSLLWLSWSAGSFRGAALNVVAHESDEAEPAVESP